MLGARIRRRSEKWKIQMQKVILLVCDPMHRYAVVSESTSTTAIILTKSVLSFL